MKTTLEALLKLVTSLRARAPAVTQPAQLDELFSALQSADVGDQAEEIEQRIWSLWAGHPDAAVARRLELATRAMAREEFDRAGRLLEPLVSEFPDWAEAHNQRATLRYLEDRDAESFESIRRTLELEPRHFGAVCGFAQICLRRGQRAAALLAFEAALAINPHLAGVSAAVEELRGTVGPTLH
jgi:Tfp pilus assembly protein PilF